MRRAYTRRRLLRELVLLGSLGIRGVRCKSVQTLPDFGVQCEREGGGVPALLRRDCGAGRFPLPDEAGSRTGEEVRNYYFKILLY